MICRQRNIAAAGIRRTAAIRQKRKTLCTYNYINDKTNTYIYKPFYKSLLQKKSSDTTEIELGEPLDKSMIFV